MPSPIKLLIEGVPWEQSEYPLAETAEESGLAEAEARWGTRDNVLVIDIAGVVWANTTGIEIEDVQGT